VIVNCQGQEELGIKIPVLYIPYPPVNRDKFSLTEWFLGKAGQGVMETGQLSCQKGFFPPTPIFSFFSLAPSQFPWQFAPYICYIK
jgi:hypothetical protein